MHKTIGYVYGFILSFLCVAPLEALCGSLMVGPGSQIINNITNVSSGYDPSMNFGNGTSTGVPVGGGMPIIPGIGTGQIPMLAPGATGGNAYVPWGQSSMLVPPLQQMMSTGMTPGMMPPGSMPPGMMPPSLMPGMMPGMMGPGQAASMGVMAQLGPNAAMMAALSGQAGTLGSAALGLPMNTGMYSGMASGMSATMTSGSTSSMTPGMNPFGGVSLPGMPFQDPSMMGMMMANMALSGTSFSSAGFGNMSMQSAMMMFSPQYQQQYNQMQATTTAKTFRILSSLTNQALVSKSESQLKKYQADLETLTSVPEENLPEGIDAVSVDTQLSRINIALTDKGSLMADPDSRTVPDKGLRADRNARLNVLLTKWTTPDGGNPVSPSKPTIPAISTIQPRTSRPGLPGVVQSPNALILAKVKQVIEKIEEDERQLTISKEELNATQDKEMIRRIEIAIYNTLIAKARQYDTLMDSITRQMWEQMIDQERGLSTSSLQLTGSPVGRPPVSRRPVPARSGIVPITSTANQFGRDEVIEIQREIQTVLAAIEAHGDMAVGGDVGMKAQLQVHLQKLDSIAKAFNDPTLPNPFRSASPEMQQVLTLWTQLNSMSLEDLQKMTAQTLQANIQTLENVLLNPKPRLHPQIKYSEIQELFDRLASVLASAEYNDANNKQGAATRTGIGGMVMRLTTVGTRARAMYNEGIGLVAYLKKGYYERSTLNSLDQSVTWDAAVDLIKQINVRSAQSKVWSSGSNRGTRVSNAQNVLKDLIDKFPILLEDERSVIISDLTRVYGPSRLASFWSNLSDYFYNADFATWPDTLQPADGNPAPKAPTSSEQRRGLFAGGR